MTATTGYNPATNYQAGDTVQTAEGIWGCLKNNTLAVSPGSNSAIWELTTVFDSETQRTSTGPKTAAYTASDGDVIFADATAGAFAITLPKPPTTVAEVMIVNIGTANAPTVVGQSGAVVSNAVIAATQWTAKRFRSYDGINWIGF